MLGPFATASRRTPHYHSAGVATVASHAACASMSTTTTTTTSTRDRGDRYGPMEWAQLCLCCIHSAGLVLCLRAAAMEAGGVVRGVGRNFSQGGGAKFVVLGEVP